MVFPRVDSILFTLILLFNILGAQATLPKTTFPHHCEDVTSNSTYQVNLNQILSSLVRSTHNISQNYGFYNYSFGQIPDKVNAFGLCRGDSEPDVCRDCLVSTSLLLTRSCPNQKTAIGGFDNCVLHYSNRSSNGLMETRPQAYSWDKKNIPSEFLDVFFQNLSTLLYDLRDRASEGGHFGKYSTGDVKTGILGYQTIYALAQCTPDLSRMDCVKCLDEVFLEVWRNHTRIGGRVLSPSCNFRYEVYRFYEDSFHEPPASVSHPRQEMSKSKSFGAGGMVVTTASVALIISVGGVYYRLKKTNIESADDTLPEVAEDIFECMEFDFRIIKDATNNFSEKNKIGTSIFGPVYKGRLRDGTCIAVRSLNYEHRDLFKNEVRFGAGLNHRNLVRLVGFSSKGSKRFLVSQFFPMSLDRIMFDPHRYLNWDKRYKIIKGIATALCYLHEESQITIIHRDIKPSKVFLDENFIPKISCFGSTQYYGASECDRVTTKVIGTVGYLAPECFMGGVVTVMSDVYSFGVLLLEIVSGQRCSNFWRDHDESFASYAWRNWKEGTITNLIDPKIRDRDFEIEEVNRCIQIGLLCVQLRSSTRPTMSLVNSMLNSNSISLPILSQFGNFDNESTLNNLAEQMMITELSDDSNDSFVSASEMSLSPISEVTSSQIIIGPDHELARERRGVLARVRCFKNRAMRSLLNKVFSYSNRRQYQLPC